MNTPSGKIVYLEKRDVGATMTCWLNCLMWLDWSAQNEGLVGYFNWPKESHIWPLNDPEMFAREPNMFNWFFLQPNQDKLDQLGFPAGQVPRSDVRWMWEEESSMPKGVPGIWPMGPKTYPWYSRLKIRPEIVARADALVQKYGLDLSNTIGISRRGCEARLDEERDHASETIESYFPELDRLMAAEPGLKIFATAEEQGDAEKVGARYPGTVIMSEFWTVPAGYGSTPGRPEHSGWCNPVSGYERGVLTCLLISILSRCKYYVRNKSNMSYVAGWIKGPEGNIRIGSRAHPEFWG